MRARMKVERPVLELESEDVSRILGPGIYVLSLRGRVVFIGRAVRSLIGSINAHMGDRFGVYGLIRPIKFDGIRIYPCRPDQLRETYERVSDELA